MSLPLLLHPAAYGDLDASRDWYEAKRQGLGDEFLAEVKSAFETIRQFPEARAVEFKNVRRALVTRFTHVIYYRIVSDIIEVVAVHHGSRHPRSWKSRLK